MSIVLRQLYPVIGILRSDVLPAQIGWALSEAAIKLAGDTNVLRDKLTGTETTWPMLYTGDVSCDLTIYVPADREFVRIERVEIRDPHDIENPEWVTIDESALVYVEGGRIAPDAKSEQDRPSAWALRSCVVYVPDPSDSIYQLRITYSWTPKRGLEFLDDALPFPSQAEDPILAYAEYLILRRYGAEQNLHRSDLALERYKASQSECRAIADTGESGCRSLFDFLPPEDNHGHPC